MSEVAFTLRKEYDLEGFQGSTSVGGDEPQVNLRELLDAGNGVIRTSDGHLIQALDGVTSLKRTTHGAADEAGAPLIPDQPGPGIADPILPVDRSLSKDDLTALAAGEGVDIEDGATKAQIADAIDAGRQGV